MVRSLVISCRTESFNFVFIKEVANVSWSPLIWSIVSSPAMKHCTFVASPLNSNKNFEGVLTNCSID